MPLRGVNMKIQMNGGILMNREKTVTAAPESILHSNPDIILTRTSCLASRCFLCESVTAPRPKLWSAGQSFHGEGYMEVPHLSSDFLLYVKSRCSDAAIRGRAPAAPGRPLLATIMDRAQAMRARSRSKARLDNYFRH